MKLAQISKQRSGSRSDLPSAAINEQFDTRDETGVIGRKKKRSLGDYSHRGAELRSSPEMPPIQTIESADILEVRL